MKNKLLLLCSCLLLSSCGVIKTSEGTRVGYVNKLSHKGILCKTYEGEIFRGGDAASYDGKNVFEFSATKKAAEKIQEAMDKHHMVSLKYEQRVMPLICTQRTDYMVVDILDLGESNGN